MPTVAVLCREERGSAAAAAIALALAHSCGSPCALAASAGLADAPRALGVAVPAARRIAAQLRARGHAATASGRLVWIGDRRAVGACDAVDAAAAASAELGRAAAVAGVPAAVALSFPRTAAVDRVLTWHEALVAIGEPDATAGAVERAAASLAALGGPVACASPPSRRAATLAELGLHAPAAAIAAVTQLALVDRGPSS